MKISQNENKKKNSLKRKSDRRDLMDEILNSKDPNEVDKLIAEISAHRDK